MAKSGETTGAFRNGLSAACMLQDMANGDAVMIKEESRDPVNVLGTSTVRFGMKP